MINTKLITILRTFSKPEINKFRDFVKSPYFNTNPNVIRLSEAVLDFYPGFDSKDLTEEKIFKKVFKNQKFEYFKIKNIISDLYQLSELFLKNISNDKDKLRNDINLLTELHERKLNTFYISKEKQISRQLESLPVKDEFYLQSLHELARNNTSHFKFKKSGYTFNLIQNEFDIFLKYSLIVLMRHYSKMLTNKNHGNIQFNMEMFDNIWEYIKDKDFEDSPSCRIYKQIISIELFRKEKDYRDLLELKEKFENNLSSEDIYYILLVANSYAAYRLKLGDESFYKDRFSMLRQMVDRKIQLPDYILFINFISTYTSACMVGEFQWAEDFLDLFRNGISPADEMSNTVNYCKGFLAYRLKEYDKALHYFSRTNFKLFLTKVMVKSFTLRIFYEQDLHEQIFSAIDSFRHYLKSEKLISEEQKAAHYEFLKHVTELTRLKSEGIKNNKDINLTMLKREIKKMQSNPLGAKNWLVEKSENFFNR
ncbi:MAG: hypothetical protein ABI462_08750 [Ignavibacteria bacterium]